ncbi:hypothetical protein CEXT_418651 [Caerostris extrusa]|uniref:Uncharacterized protein n=1 Tax=Caerostris extrusa TaxID=172846 RepID=A0AAV4VNS8_CAEEX|nr:hypothetical protein CEXT_418651 [Caerostris extrusa]
MRGGKSLRNPHRKEWFCHLEDAPVHPWDTDVTFVYQSLFAIQMHGGKSLRNPHRKAWFYHLKDAQVHPMGHRRHMIAE